MPQSTVQKLGIRAGMTVLVIGQPLEIANGLLGELPTDALVTDVPVTDVQVIEGAPTGGVVLLFADDVATVSTSARLGFERAADGGRFWIAYRKGANRKPAAGEPAPLHRDTLQGALAPLGLDGVTLVSLDDVWSAMRVKAA